MNSGAEKGKENVNAFKAWVATQSDDDFTNITYRGQLSRVEVAKAIGCGKSALVQNPELKNRLQKLEDDLRSKGVLPALTAKAKLNEGIPSKYDNEARQRSLSAKHSSSLERENIELKAKVKELESKLERFGELSSTLADMGLFPR